MAACVDTPATPRLLSLGRNDGASCPVTARTTWLAEGSGAAQRRPAASRFTSFDVPARQRRWCVSVETALPMLA